jgi:hypothetical protein
MYQHGGTAGNWEPGGSSQPRWAILGCCLRNVERVAQRCEHVDYQDHDRKWEN